jgi:hypothetical protein
MVPRRSGGRRTEIPEGFGGDDTELEKQTKWQT